MSDGQRLSLGIDLGGTSVKVGVVTPRGEIIGRAKVATEADQGPERVAANMARGARQALAAAGVGPDALGGVGIGAPGTCNVAEGIVAVAVNLGWHDVPVVRMLTEALGLPVHLDNDANCAALGEQWCGAAQGSAHMLMLTVGTGVGGGLILDGRIYHGFKGWAGEFGHMPAMEGGPRCNCGQSGCLETVASATAIANAAQREIAAGRAPGLALRAERQQGFVDTRLVITAAREGDAAALSILREAGEHLGTAVAALIGALNPELVVIGGGASAAGELLLAPVREVVRRKAMPGPASVVRIVEAKLGNDAGLIGAASLIWR